MTAKDVGTSALVMFLLLGLGLFTLEALEGNRPLWQIKTMFKKPKWKAVRWKKTRRKR